MMAANPGATVLLSEAESAASLAAGLATRSHPVTWYTSFAQLVGEQPLSSVEVLILHFSPQPKGVMLPVIARMAMEYPGLQMVVVMEDRPPLRLAEYLTACGADLIWTVPKEEKVDRLASLVDRMHERTRWIAH